VGQLAEPLPAVRRTERAAGVRPGDSVALFAANCPNIVEILFSIGTPGPWPCPSTRNCTPREVAAAAAEQSRTGVLRHRDIAEALAGRRLRETPVVPIGAQEDNALPPPSPRHWCPVA